MNARVVVLVVLQLDLRDVQLVVRDLVSIGRVRLPGYPVALVARVTATTRPHALDRIDVPALLRVVLGMLEHVVIVALHRVPHEARQGCLLGLGVDQELVHRDPLDHGPHGRVFVVEELFRVLGPRDQRDAVPEQEVNADLLDVPLEVRIADPPVPRVGQTLSAVLGISIDTRARDLHARVGHHQLRHVGRHELENMVLGVVVLRVPGLTHERPGERRGVSN